MLFRSSVMRPRAKTLSPNTKSVGAILMNLSFVFSPGGIRMNTVLSLSVTVTWLPAAVVMMTWRVSGLRSETTPITLSAVIAGSAGGGLGVCAFSVVALASKANTHSTLGAKCLTWNRHHGLRGLWQEYFSRGFTRI